MTIHLPLPPPYVIDPNPSPELRAVFWGYVRAVEEWIQELEVAARAKAEQDERDVA